MNTEWILYPVCGNKTRDRMRKDTREAKRSSARLLDKVVGGE